MRWGWGGEAGWGGGCTNLMGLPVRGRDRRIRRGLHEVCWVFEWYLCGGGWDEASWGGGGLYKFGRLASERERQENQTGLTQSVQRFWYSL